MPINYVELEPKKIPKKKPRFSRFLKIVAAAVLLFVTFFASFLTYTYPKVNVLRGDLATLSGDVEKIKAAVESQDVTSAREAIASMNSTLKKTDTDLDGLGFLGKIPVIKNYYSDVDHSVTAAILGTEAAEIVADSILPFADILGLKGAESNLKAEEKAQVIVTQVFPNLSKKAELLEVKLEQLKKELDYIDTGRYPRFLTIRGYKVVSSLEEAKGAIVQVENYFPSIKTFLDAVPDALGYQQEKTYLLWFQNDKELRPTGGFITAYGILKIKDGKLLSVDSDDIYQLDLKFAPFESAHPIYRKYLLTTVLPIRDTNISPDFKLSAQKFESYYQRIRGMPKIDGIIAVDTEFVREFLEFTGPITIKKFNETFSAAPHKKYPKIPDVVYKLELYAEKVLAGNRDRKGLVGDLMDEMLKKILGSSPEKFPEILKIVQTSLEEKHLLFYFQGSAPQKLVEELNFAGRITDFDGDYLHLNNANIAGLKGNLYTKVNLEEDIVISSDGGVTKKVKVTLTNAEKADGWLNSVYQNWMRLYIPKDSVLIEKQVQRDFAAKVELGKTVWESFSRTPPLKSSETSFTYTLPFRVNKGETYRHLIQKQPGTTDPHVIIRLNGKKLYEFDLKKDTLLEFRI